MLIELDIGPGTAKSTAEIKSTLERYGLNMDNRAALTKVYAGQHYLTSWNRVLLKKLVFTKLLKKFPVLNTTQNSMPCPKECVRQREGENKGTI